MNMENHENFVATRTNPHPFYLGFKYFLICFSPLLICIMAYWGLMYVAIIHIEKLGGGVVHDSKLFQTVYEEVSLNNTKATDSDLWYVRQLSPGSVVRLANTNLSDTGLQHLYGLRLRRIDLSGTATSEKAIEKLMENNPNVHAEIIKDDRVLKKEAGWSVYVPLVFE